MEQYKFKKTELISLESVEISPEKREVLERIKSGVEKSKDILSARVYGSWLHSEESTDLDICIMIASEEGVVNSDVYKRLKSEREELAEKTGQNVDLVPHTMDEINDFRSDLYYPRYNPSLVAGIDVKGKLDIEPIFDKNDSFTYADLLAHILLDNRTICRRQIVRSLNPAESKIFASKLLHGPGNALTYHSCKQKVPYLVSPSDLAASLEMYDKIYNVDSGPAMDFLSSCKKGLNYENALILLTWYERLVNVVLYGNQHKEGYQKYCAEIGRSKTAQ